MKYIAPSITATAFNCPHCGVLTTQHWHYGYVEKYDKGKTPLIIPQDDPGATFRFDSFTEGMRTGQPFIFNDAADSQSNSRLYNLDFTQCYECEKLSVWIFDRLIYPVTGEAPPPNPDLPNDIKADYLEASSILHLSPRAASALIRLCIQKLCIHLGQSGKNINNDIGELVAKGLDSRVQKAMDAVRVIGNNAVHPGQIDVTDDRGIAESLLGLLNVVAEKMISEPKRIDEIYASLPPSALKQIEERDKKGGA
ncbi:DUF4145 domain-containing protein (plasmid) [Rhizobium ruizarguesonis]|uniref:DUF4145 domain-containing protein n=1 Tax=Rhizobium ruizarguesonis TaxID=2081791 RepID=UPI00102FF82B|nr:DUF4145 domain-containing protein [Rhizobium ruizarguesonis]TBB62464.1 DUF4145 domain-containing protein [Rhizobium ruizarguesonis]